jgi:glycerate kinase
MKIVIAVDSFKGSLTANQACEIIRNAFLKHNSSLEVVCKPLADGGEGTASILLKATKSKWIDCCVMGPLPPAKVKAGFVWIEETKTALIEMASANGITLLEKHQLNPFKASTFGTGQLIVEALKYNPSKICMAVGGSATVDCGIGAAMAVGWKFLDENNQPISLGGEAITRIRRMIPPNSLKVPKFQVLCDVTNPLFGPNGAAYVFGPQKGATPEMVKLLDCGLEHVADMVTISLNKNINIPGSGAAGGLAGGALAFFDAELSPGIEAIMDIILFNEAIKDADWIITGEGCFDSQSLNGKVVSGVIERARTTSAKIGIISGDCKLNPEEWKNHDIKDVAICRKPDMDLDFAIQHAPELLAKCAHTFLLKNFVTTDIKSS